MKNLSSKLYNFRQHELTKNQLANITGGDTTPPDPDDETDPIKGATTSGTTNGSGKITVVVPPNIGGTTDPIVIIP